MSRCMFFFDLAPLKIHFVCYLCLYYCILSYMAIYNKITKVLTINYTKLFKKMFLIPKSVLVSEG
jgi:TctA family transporter